MPQTTSAVRIQLCCGSKTDADPLHHKDIFGSLGGEPDFGLPADFITDQIIAKRALMKTTSRRRNLPVLPLQIHRHH